MNHDETKPDLQSWMDPAVEARVIAWVLGEASAFEVAELERLIAESPELGIFKRRIEAVHGLVGEAVRPVRLPLRLSPERRAKVLAVIGAVETPVVSVADAWAAKEAAVFKAQKGRSGGGGSWWGSRALEVAVCLAILGILAAVTIPTVGKVRGTAGKEKSRDSFWSVDTVFSSKPATEEQSQLAYSSNGPVGAVDEGMRAVEAPAVRASAPAPMMAPPPPPPSEMPAPVIRLDGALDQAIESPYVAVMGVDGNASGGVARRADAMEKRMADTGGLNRGFGQAEDARRVTYDEFSKRKQAQPKEPFARGNDSGAKIANAVSDEKADADGPKSEARAYEGMSDQERLFAVASQVRRRRAPSKKTVDYFAPVVSAEEEVPAEQKTAKGVAASSVVVSKMEEVIIPHVNFSGVEFTRALSTLSAVSEDRGTKAPNIVLTGVEGLEQPKVNLTLRNLSLKRTLDIMTESVGYVYEIQGDIVVIRPGPEALAVAAAAPKVDSLREEVSAANEAVSTFSLHVSDASYRLARAALARGEAPDAATIRPEEFYNAFDYGDAAPAAGEPVAGRIEQAAHPFLQQRNLVRVALRVPAAGRGAGTALHLTVLLDTSGSMEREDRAATVRAALGALATLLGPNDRVTLIGFARQPRLLVEGLPGDQAQQLVELAANTPAEGGTNLEEALRLAGDLARRQFLAGAQNRIVLLTDGAANLGDADPARLMAQVEGLRRQGVAFDACGVGAAGLDDTVLESLTRKGDGRYQVLNSPEEADAGFARKLAGAFRPAAENVKVQVRFNPARVGRYRLIGFEKHRLREEDFRNDKVDAAELAAEEAAVALYQVEVLPGGEGALGEVAVRFRDTARGALVERTWTLDYVAQPPAFDKASASLRLAGASALVAEKLRGGAVGGQIRLEELAPVVAGLRGAYAGDARVQDFITMFGQARRLTGE